MKPKDTWRRKTTTKLEKSTSKGGIIGLQQKPSNILDLTEATGKTKNQNEMLDLVKKENKKPNAWGAP